MNKVITVLATIGFALSMTACASVGKFVQDFLPTVQGTAGAAGLTIDVDSEKLVESVPLFCLEEDGKIAETLNKVPVLGDFLVNAVGVCEEAEEEVPPAEEPSGSDVPEVEDVPEVDPADGSGV